MLENDFRNRLLESLDTHFKTKVRRDVPISTEVITQLLGLKTSVENLRAVQFGLKHLLGEGYLDARESDAAGGPVLVFDLTSAGRAAAEALTSQTAEAKVT